MPQPLCTRGVLKIDRIKSPELKLICQGLVPALANLGYDHCYKNVSWHPGGMVLTIHIKEDSEVCSKCGSPSKLKYKVRDGEMRKGCFQNDCPCQVFQVSHDPTFNQYTINDLGVEQAGRTAVPNMHPLKNPNVRELDMYNDNEMAHAAVEKGYKLAVVVKKLAMAEPLGIENVFDGSHWWYWSEETLKWAPDKSQTAIHKTVFRLIDRGYIEFLKKQNEREIVLACSDIIKKINQRVFRKHIVDDCMITFEDTDFLKKLDSKPNLIGCKNGVYDLDDQSFGRGRPTDYLTMNTGRNFLVDVDMYNTLLEVRDFLEDVLVDKAVVQMMLCAFAKSLHGGTNLQRFFLWVGCGSNGKSKLAYLLRTVLGDYCVTVPVTVRLPPSPLS